MKLVAHFSDFLTNTVNLNTTRIERLESSVEAIKNVISDSDWQPRRRGFLAQGSWAHKTIIKPLEGNAFDADLLVFVDAEDSWDAEEYVDSLYKLFRNHGTYEDKIDVWEYCVTITYAGDFKIDVVPCVKDRQVVGYEVCDRVKNRFDPSKPTEYTDWIVARNTWTGSNAFRKVTRLLKYLRDIKGNFTCPSVLLTTLLGQQVTLLDQYNRTPFVDVPTALRTIVDRLDDWLQIRPTKPSVPNPVLPTEDFARLWSDETKYANFRDKIHLYRGWVDDAYQEPDRDESIGKWRRVFGEEFAKGVNVEAAAIEKSAAMALAESSAMVPAGPADMVTLLSVFGRRAIPEQITRLPYMERPRWKSAGGAQFQVSVAVSLHMSKLGSLVRAIRDLAPLPKGSWLKFVVYGPGGIPLSREYAVHWRVTNTGGEATRANQLRGDYYVSNDPDDRTSRWEQLSYRGLHVVEAFVVRRRDERLVFQSAPCYVVIG